jgi:hypothetical protein
MTMAIPPLLFQAMAALGVVLGAAALVVALRVGREADMARRRPPAMLRPPTLIEREAATRSELGRLRAEVDELGRELSEVAGELARLRVELEGEQLGSVRYALRDGPAPVERAPANLAPEFPPEPRGRPVELRGEELCLSRSLSAIGSLVVESEPGGPAYLYLNEQAQIDHVAFERWSKFFEFRGGGPYMRYRTVRPARVDWNEDTGSGIPTAPGVADALS